VRYLSLAEVLLLHRLVMEQSRQQALLRDLGALESALNGRRIEATVDEAEQAILNVASGRLDRAGLQAWIEAHEVPRS
jgi:hypothetical protein